ncbi:hypothetical protein [Pseudomonas guariconensis]|uniref:hypothetical protein n=1 Tax=Pseudomonas guariconensis TaxID=1288410 RepID=UPI0018AAA65A|nr:hypothetical protein [Pseudomonas guariconensis]MBF8740226.1 hypothetical protein [Pseudomonas guariconensis]MBF8750369.1 hypothetical protein [Pseudomonas guariconensis]
MKPFDPYDILLKAESLGLGDNLRASEIVYHLEQIEALLANEQTEVTKATADQAIYALDSGVDITCKILMEKYRQ